MFKPNVIQKNVSHNLPDQYNLDESQEEYHSQASAIGYIVSRL